MKFRLLHCSWDHHPQMEPEFWTNAIYIEKTTRGPIFQKHLKSCSCHSDRNRHIFKEPKHPEYRGLLEDNDHLFYIPKWTSFENRVWQGGSEHLWDPMGDALVMGARGCCCCHLQTLGLAEAGTAIASEGRSMPAAPGQEAHAASSTPSTSSTQVGFGVTSRRAWLFAKGATFVISPQYDSPPMPLAYLLRGNR